MFHNQFEKIIVPSNETKNTVEKEGFISPEVIPTPVNPKRKRDLGSTFLKKYKIKKPYALFVGRITKEKNIETILSAETDFQILIAGTGPHITDLKKSAPPNVKFIGFLRESLLNQAYSHASVSLMPSETDTQGLTVLESLSCGTPVLTRNIGGPKELIKKGVNGDFFEDSNDLSKKLEKYPKRCVKKCLDSSKKYSLNVLGRKLENLYIKLNKSEL